ncbi:hypothetical protein Acr_07g0017640 [Actinidia rufa]|uniref:Uncharacterized protein n=1 Tax=Actinidia rufa TaxID=165716 RepID=A0A7J0EYS8_9ERIC|nr:hypothetical protein Acr_07g0017640 [Actinidia rufa]
MEGSLVKGHLSWASIQYSLANIGNSGLNPRRKRAQFSQAIQIALSHDVKLFFKGRASIYLGISPMVRRFVSRRRFLRRGRRELLTSSAMYDFSPMWFDIQEGSELSKSPTAGRRERDDEGEVKSEQEQQFDSKSKNSANSKFSTSPHRITRCLNNAHLALLDEFSQSLFTLPFTTTMRRESFSPLDAHIANLHELEASSILPMAMVWESHSDVEQTAQAFLEQQDRIKSIGNPESRKSDSRNHGHRRRNCVRFGSLSGIVKRIRTHGLLAMSPAGFRENSIVCPTKRAILPDRRVLSLVRFRLRQLVSEPCLYPGLMANTREGSINEETTGETITRGEFRQFQQETQQILRDLQQAIAALLPREPYHGVAGLHQECQERDHRGYDRGPIHPNRPPVYEDESSEDEAYAHEVFGGGRDQEGRGQRGHGQGNHDQGGRMFWETLNLETIV